MRKLIVLITAVSLLGALPVAAGWEEGVAAFTSKKYQDAATEFQQLVDQNPEGYRGHYMLGLSLEQLKRKEEALYHLRKAYDLNPNDLSIKVALGRAFFNVRRYNDVVQLLSSVDASSLPAAQQVAFYQIRGQAKFKAGNADAAVQDFKQLASLRPNDAQIQYMYGTTALSLGQTDAGIAALNKSVALAPNDVDKKRSYAQALIKKGRMTPDKNAKKQSYLKASELATAVAAKTGTFDDLMLRVSAELGAGRYKDAISSSQAAIAKSSSGWLAHYYLGQAYSSDGQYSEAEASLASAKAKTSKPDDLKLIWRQLGYTLEKQKKYTQSIEAYQNAGDQAGVARVKKNEETDAFNKNVEAENAAIKEMEAEAKRLEDELKALEGGGGAL